MELQHVRILKDALQDSRCLGFDIDIGEPVDTWRMAQIKTLECRCAAFELRPWHANPSKAVTTHHKVSSLPEGVEVSTCRAGHLHSLTHLDTASQIQLQTRLYVRRLNTCVHLGQKSFDARRPSFLDRLVSCCKRPISHASHVFLKFGPSSLDCFMKELLLGFLQMDQGSKITGEGGKA